MIVKSNFNPEPTATERAKNQTQCYVIKRIDLMFVLGNMGVRLAADN